MRSIGVLSNMGDVGLVRVLNCKVIENGMQILDAYLGTQFITTGSNEDNLSGLWVDRE
jgi:hypothetical protein